MITININLVKQLINEQFPHWAHLDIKPVVHGGNDNRTFHLGKDMSVRLPSAEGYVPQVEKEQKWLPFLASQLTLPIQTPIAKGEPSEDYPMPWSINKWLDGEVLTHDNVNDLHQLAKDLGSFLLDLQAIDSSEGPLGGAHNFHRGGDLAVYDQETRSAVAEHKKSLPIRMITEIWDQALATKWQTSPVWVHGDVAPGNLLVKNGKLCAVIDFGILGVGDPACDAAIAWTFFDRASRKTLKNSLKMDDDTWDRAKGWALWKALITYNGDHASDAYRVISEILER